jgi:hypothetical protein
MWLVKRGQSPRLRPCGQFGKDWSTLHNCPCSCFVAVAFFQRFKMNGNWWYPDANWFKSVQSCIFRLILLTHSAAWSRIFWGWMHWYAWSFRYCAVMHLTDEILTNYVFAASYKVSKVMLILPLM